MTDREAFPDCKDLKKEIEKLKKINRVLVERVEHSMDHEGDSYALFQAAITLDDKVRERTSTLEHTVDSLKNAKEKAEQAVQEKSRFLARMSHELRTPMNAILGFGQLMLEDTASPLSEKHSDYMLTILKAGEHLLELINEVLDLARIDAGKMCLTLEDIDARLILMECFSLLKPVADKRGIELVFGSEQCISCFIQADSMRFKQVLINLLTNAIKYNRESGQVVLSCDMSKNNWVRFMISDQGVGFTSDKYKQIFEPFERLEHHAEIKGSGMGLTVTRQLVELMGGEIGVESTLGTGSTFWFELPVGQVLSLNKKIELIENVPHRSNEKKRLTLLYIEDNIDNIKLVSEIIKAYQGIQFLTAQTAELGLDIAIAHQPDLILLDINLPDMNGNELLREMLQIKETKYIPVVAISADAMKEDIEKALKNGFKQYITKPINIAEFKHLIDYHLISQNIEVQNQ